MEITLPKTSYLDAEKLADHEDEIWRQAKDNGQKILDLMYFDVNSFLFLFVASSGFLLTYAKHSESVLVVLLSLFFVFYSAVSMFFLTSPDKKAQIPEPLFFAPPPTLFIAVVTSLSLAVSGGVFIFDFATDSFKQKDLNAIVAGITIVELLLFLAVSFLVILSSGYSPVSEEHRLQKRRREFEKILFRLNTITPEQMPNVMIKYFDMVLGDKQFPAGEALHAQLRKFSRNPTIGEYLWLKREYKKHQGVLEKTSVNKSVVQAELAAKIQRAKVLQKHLYLAS